MLLYEIIDFPNQALTVETSVGTFTILLRYSQRHDHWSYSIFEQGASCPIVAGRRVVEGIDLFRFVSSIPDALIFLVRNGADQLVGNQYDLATRDIGGRLAYLGLLSPEEIEGLSRDAIQPCC